MSTRTFLVHGLVAGLLAGIAAFVVAYTVGEPQIDQAIALEEAASAPAASGEHSHDDGAAAGHSHDDEDAVVTRSTQSTWGLATGTLGIGIVLGGFTGLLAAVGLGRLGRLRPAGSTALVALLAATSFSIVPFLKYPATPPAVGSGETIDSRTALYFGFLAVDLREADRADERGAGHRRRRRGLRRRGRHGAGTSAGSPLTTAAITASTEMLAGKLPSSSSGTSGSPRC